MTARLHLKLKHRELIQKGQYDVARKMLRFLRLGRITLGLGDTDCLVQNILDDHNVKFYGDSRGYHRTYFVLATA